jgi:hypothetical protein
VIVIGSAFLSTGGDGDRQSARAVAIRGRCVYLFFLRSSELTALLQFLVPKEFLRRRIRHLAIGLGIVGSARKKRQRECVSSSSYGANAISGLL